MVHGLPAPRVRRGRADRVTVGRDYLPELRRRERQREVGPLAVVAGGIAAFGWLYVVVWFMLLAFGA